MSVKASPTVTVTLKRTTIEALRRAKGNTRWDAYLLKLASLESQGARAECMKCGRVLETEDVGKSPELLAQENSWTAIAVRGRGDAIGFICPACMAKVEAED